MNIQEQLNSLIRGNPLSVDTYLREVCKNEHISDTKASMHIYMLKLDGNNRPRTCDFCDYLINRIVDYCIPPSEIRKAKEKDAEYNTTQYTATLFRKAERLFTDLGNTGEVGELALSVLTQSFLHTNQCDYQSCPIELLPVKAETCYMSMVLRKLKKLLCNSKA